MQKLQCAVSNSVSHFIVILIYPNGFQVCACMRSTSTEATVSRECARLSCRGDADSPLCPLASPLRMHYQAWQTPPVWKALYGTWSRVLHWFGWPAQFGWNESGRTPDVYTRSIISRTLPLDTLATYSGHSHPAYTHWPAKDSGFIDAPLPRLTCKKRANLLVARARPDGKFGRTHSNFGRSLEPWTRRSASPTVECINNSGRHRYFF